jgi:RHS repeat-associated protein
MCEKFKKNYFFKVIARILIFCMIIQGMPLMQLSQAYEWRFKPERIKRLIDLLGPVSAEAAPPKVVCVPQLPTDLLIPHETWSGEPTIVKGIARDADDNLGGGEYYWEMGDGTSTDWAPISNSDNLAVTHTYNASTGTLIVARLHVKDAAGESSSDEYRILVKAKTLDVEVNKAIDDGLWWLYTNKEKTGAYFRWNNIRYGNHYSNSTASSVQAYLINGHLESGNRDEDPYVDVVRGGIDFLLSQMYSYNIGIQTYGNPDTNGNGIGITVSSDRQIYELGAVMDALVATGTPDTVARSGGANVIGRRYQDIVQDMCDMYAWGQYDHATIGGGWRYAWNQGPDNSAAQWGAIGMLAAERYFGCTVPQWVKERNNVWLNYSYNGTGFGYTGKGNDWATTPSGMVQMAFDGFDTTNSRWQTAEIWLDSNWNSFIGTNRDNRYYSYYAFTKAMRLANPQEVTHLASGLDWYGDNTRGLARILVDRQNSNGSWPYDGWPYVGERTAAAWNVIILTRTLFEKPPVALVHAEPNPGALGQKIQLDASGSYHIDPAKTIVEYRWDFDAADGVDFNNPDAVGITAEALYGALGDYTVSLMVVDNSTPARFSTASIVLHITIPPHPPTAIIGGPYVSVVGEPVAIGGSGSYDVDEPLGDQIKAWEWEVDFLAPYDFNEATGEKTILPGYGAAGSYDIALRVTDDTAAVFPQSGSPDLTHIAFGRVQVYNSKVNDLAARPKETKCQLTWTHVGVDQYEVLRSEQGPNQGYALIGNTDSTYSTFIDYNVVMKRDYWYRIRFLENNEIYLSEPVHINSAGRIRNLPPVITSTPITSAIEGQVYRYAVKATDPEGRALTYVLDQAPAGMTIDPAGGQIIWTPAFHQAGLSDVAVRVSDALSASASQFFQIQVSPRPNTDPIANPGGPYSGMINMAVSFDASASMDPEGDPIVLYRWVFGDGHEGEGLQVQHIYAAPGTYTVTLYATDERGATGQAETVCQIQAPNRPPTAVISGSSAGETGVPVAFNAISSSDPDGDPLIFTWNFGDSTPAATGELVLHTFVDAGTYMVTLTADDGRGGLDTAELTVLVSPPNMNPTAVFTITGDQTSLQTLTFDASASSDPEGQPLTAFEWDFGDGSATTGQIVTHVFESIGNFTVTLTVADDKGAQNISQQTLTIAEIMVPVPDVTNQEQSAAETAITAAGLTVGDISTEFNISVPGNHVIRQVPVGGASAAVGARVDLVISLGPEPVIVPSVIGMVQADAEAAIVGANLLVGSVVSQYSDTVPAHEVISQAPLAGATILSGSRVDIVVSLGIQPVSVPQLVGLPQVDAETSISGANLVLGTLTTQYSPVIAAGLVISQTPAAGTSVSPGSAVDIVISLGPEPGIVPDVVGMAQAMAQSAIINAGYTIGTIDSRYDGSIPAGRVISQTPGAGSTALPGTPVNLVISLGVQPVTVPQMVGLSQANAEAAIFAAGLALGSVNSLYSASVPVGNVISHTPVAGTVVSPGTGVSLVVSLGPSPVTDFLRPQVTVSVSPSVADIGATVMIAVTAADNDAVAAVRLLVDGMEIPLDGSGTASFSSNAAGIFTAVGIATDASGNQGQAAKEFRFIASGDTTGPHVAITAPLTDAEISIPTDLIGTADDDEQLMRYALAYSVKDANAYVTFFTSDLPVNNGVLGQLDPTRLRNGLYDIRLTAEDASGNTASVIRTFQFSGEAKVGAFTMSFIDAAVPVAGLDLSIIRTYDSRVKSKGDFGIGWSLGMSDIKVEENRVPGNGWETYCIEWGVRPSAGHTVLVTFPDGREHKFEVRGVTSYADPGGLAQGSLVFDAMPGTESTLQALDNSSYDFLMGGDLMDFDFRVINPDRYRLTDVDGTQYVFSQRDGIQTITDPNGNTMTFTSGGIIHSAGRSVLFDRDASGRIIKITDPEGEIVTYDYDFYGDLVGVTDQEGNLTQFVYNSDHGLIEVIDPRGITPARNEYDEEGRLAATIDANGNRIEFIHNLGASQEVVVDRRGNLTVYEYDDKGNVISKADAMGYTTLYTYDADGNKLSETDPLGRVKTWTYNSKGKILSETDALGHTTLYTYDARGNKLSETDPLGNITTWTYDASGNILTKTDPENQTTTFTYDIKGNKLTESDCFGHVTTWTYDSAGNQITETDPLGNLTSRTYDANGNQLTQTRSRTTASGVVTMTTTKSYNAMGQMDKITDADGNATLFEFNPIRKKSAEIDPNGNRREYRYDARGNLVQTIYPDGTSETNTYDANNNRVGSTDRTGRTTAYEYDSLNRLTRMVYPDGSIGENQYDEAGQIIATKDGNGNLTTYVYDAAGRRIRTIDALGNQTEFSYNAAGNQIGMTDANGNSVQYEYDALNRRTATVFADGTRTQTAFEGCSKDRKILETDQAGLMTFYNYDENDRLIRVTDALGNITTYAYDEVGNRIRQTDANGHVTSFAYDNSGRLSARTLPLGMVETHTYDANGNRTRIIDFKGDATTMTYDANNRLVAKIYADGSRVDYSYTGTGKPEEVTDSIGKTAYTYDLRDRLLSVVNPDGTAIDYTYDAAGNRTSVNTASGTILYAHDALNRLAQVTDPDGGMTAYAYDPAGNRESITYPNGMSTEYRYDSLNRLIGLQNKRSDATVVSGYTYTLSPSGNRNRVVEESGRVVEYTYDAVYRLIQENITDPVSGIRTITYTYDPVGNRLSKTDGSTSTAYVYDANDRLLTEGAITYTYDANGNMIGKSEGGQTFTYDYDGAGRLVGVAQPGKTIAYDYDADGHRVTSVVNGSATFFLVDKNLPFAQVLEERNSSGTLTASYVYGDDLLRQQRTGQVRYYLYDGVSSTRQMADDSQTITDTYDFDAFGIEIHRTGTTVNHYLYSGEQYDPNAGFYYLRARYYNQMSGRFISQDPAQGNPFEPMSLHKYLYANANPIMYIDPGGEMSLANVMVSIAIVGILSSVLYAGTAHLISAGRTPVEWNGLLMYGGGGSGVGGLGFFAVLNSDCHFGKKSSGIYLMGAVGATWGPLPVSMGIAFIKLQTPGLWGPAAWTLVGPFSWISATASWGVGVSWTAMYMGMGIGELGWIPGLAIGIDIGLDIMGGVSIPLMLGDEDDC